MYFERFGFCIIIFISILCIKIFFALNNFIILFKSIDDLMSLYFGVFGNNVPISPLPVAPNKLSINAWITLSPSECPKGPKS